MLKRVSIVEPQIKLEWLETFQPQNQSWLVADLKSKIELQTRLLSRHQALEAQAVMRSSELWRRLVWENDPEVRFVSMDLVRSLVQRELKKHNISWAKGPGAAQSLTQMMPQFLPLFAQINEIDLVRQWLQANVESLLKWGHWFELGQYVWEALQVEHLLPAAWAPAYLLSQNFKLTWSRDLIVDLSFQLTPLEELLLSRLAETRTVTLLEPKPSWNQAQPEISSFKLKSNYRLARFSSPLAEVKDAVAQVRKWAEEGVSLRKIAIVAPDIESYWPLLAPSLQEEGMIAEKSRQMRLHAHQSIQIWLSHVRLKMGGLKANDLELAASPYWRTQYKIPYERFKRLFTHLYSAEQFQTESWLQQQFSQDLHPEETLSRDQFLMRTLIHWSDQDWAPLERLLKSLLEDCPPQLELRCQDWLTWIESWCAQIEMPIHFGQNGLRVTNLMSVEWMDLECLYCLGFSEENLKSFNAQGLSAREAQKIEQDLGILVPACEQNSLELEARWILDRSLKDGVLSCAMTDPTGAPLTPSKIWLLQHSNPKLALSELSTPQVTRWDEMQQATVQEIALYRNWPENHMQELIDALAQDLGLKPLPPFGFEKVKRLSPSALERYCSCPFMYAAERLFRLSNRPIADLDVDPLTKGSLIHKVFEVLTAEPRRFDWKREEIEDILDQGRREFDFPDLGLWTQIKAKFIEVALRFLKAEQEWFRQFPATKTVARELQFEAAWSVQQKRVIALNEATAADLKFTGRIDRVDGSENEYVILDYKASLNRTHSAVNWPQKDAFQLALYCEVVEQGLSELPAKTVRGAFYYSAADFERSKGLHIEGENNLIPTKGRRNSNVSPEKKEEVFSQLKEKIADILARTNRGEFSPQPRDINDCQNCLWRDVCRAPHLN